MRLAALLLAALLACGCTWSRGVSPLLDGIRVGDVMDCSECHRPQANPDCGACESVASLARAGFEVQWPGHPPIVALAYHAEGLSPGPNGELLLNNRSGSLIVAVATFADGARHAVALHCGVGSCRAIAWYRSDHLFDD